MPLDELFERLAISRAGARYESAVLKVSRGVIDEGVSDAHGSSFRVRGPQRERSNGVQTQRLGTTRAATRLRRHAADERSGRSRSSIGCRV